MAQAEEEAQILGQGRISFLLCAVEILLPFLRGETNECWFTLFLLQECFRHEPSLADDFTDVKSILTLGFI